MKLKVLLPDRVMIDEQEVRRVYAEAENGAFELLEHHVDFAAALAPGILWYAAAGGEGYLAVNGGVLVKTGAEVVVSTGEAVAGGELGTLRETIAGDFEMLDENEKKARAALARLEAGFTRGLMELKG